MPATLILEALGYAAAGSAAAATAATVISASAYAAAAFAINFAASYVLTRIFGAQPPNQSDPGVRQQIPPNSTNSIPVVYGDAWLGGTFVDAVLSTDQKTMYYVLAISNIAKPDASGLITSVQFSYNTSQFYYGDRLVTFDGTDPTKVISLTDGAGNVDTKISGNLYINLYTSTAAGVITNINGSSPSTVMGGADIDASLRWPATNRQMNGLAFAIVKLIYNRDAGTTSLSPITFKCSHYLNGAGVAKPGDVLYDYLTNTVYGGAVPLANVNSTQCTALNTYSDATITYTPSGGGSATQARYRINGVLNTGETVLNNVDKILTSCDSWLAYQASTGQWSPVVNKAESSSFSFDDSNVIGEIRVSVTDLASSINQIEVSFPFKSNKDQPEYVYLETPSGLLYPNEPVNKYSATFDLVNDSVQATYLANRVLKQAREDLIVTFSTAYPGIQVNAGDVISITNADYGWSSKLFRVTKVQETSLPDGNLGARIECAEYNVDVYSDGSITQFTPAANSSLSSAYYFPTLAAPTTGDLSPSANVPTFSVTTVVPTTARTTALTLYYTTATSPTDSDWKTYSSQYPASSTAFTPGASIKFTDVSLPAGTYYFAIKAENEQANSKLSTTSSSLTWTPGGSTLTATLNAGALTFITTTGTHVAGSRTVTASGGTSPYSYAWSILSQYNDNNNSDYFYLTGTLTSNTVGVSCYISSINTVYGTVVVTVTDSTGKSVDASFLVTCVVP